MDKTKPKIAITMGDPAGIGAEIVVKALLNWPQFYEQCDPLVVGDEKVIREALRFSALDAKVQLVNSPDQKDYRPGIINVIDLNNIDLKKLEYGKVSAMCGKAAGDYIATAIQLAINNDVDATVTSPINKESFYLGGWGKKYIGHTEMFAGLTGTARYSMMLCHEHFRTVHVSTHVSLREATEAVKRERVLNTIRVANNACLDLGIEHPRIGVAALNPHAGEGGLIGREEIDEIAPAIEDAKSEGIDADGPVPGDTVYAKAKGGWYDMVVSMYHDQGHIPMKLAGFIWSQDDKRWTEMRGVNATLGLPIIRTSVDHGTAFGKAGKGIANASSLADAIELAIQLAKVRLLRRKIQ